MLQRHHRLAQRLHEQVVPERELHREHHDPEQRVDEALLERRRELRGAAHVRLAAHAARADAGEGHRVHEGERLEVLRLPVLAAEPLQEVEHGDHGERPDASHGHGPVPAALLAEVAEVQRGELGGELDDGVRDGCRRDVGPVPAVREDVRHGDVERHRVEQEHRVEVDEHAHPARHLAVRLEERAVQVRGGALVRTRRRA